MELDEIVLMSHNVKCALIEVYVFNLIHLLVTHSQFEAVSKVLVEVCQDLKFQVVTVLNISGVKDLASSKEELCISDSPVIHHVAFHID